MSVKETSISNVDIVVYALYQLGGVDKKIHTEKVCHKCYELSKKRFSWRLPEFSRFPDKEPVRIALMDAAKEKKGQLVQGRSGVESTGKETDGWLLTPSGAKWVLENQERLEKELNLASGGTNRPDALRIKKRFHQDQAFKKFLHCGNLDTVSQYEFTDMLNCTPDANKATIQKKFERLKTQASVIEDARVQNFIKACEKKFEDLLIAKTERDQNEAR